MANKTIPCYQFPEIDSLFGVFAGELKDSPELEQWIADGGGYDE